jgi:hypothetical protein
MLQHGRTLRECKMISGIFKSVDPRRLQYFLFYWFRRHKTTGANGGKFTYWTFQRTWNSLLSLEEIKFLFWRFNAMENALPMSLWPTLVLGHLLMFFFKCHHWSTDKSEKGVAHILYSLGVEAGYRVLKHRNSALVEFINVMQSLLILDSVRVP